MSKTVELISYGGFGLSDRPHLQVTLCKGTFGLSNFLLHLFFYILYFYVFHCASRLVVELEADTPHTPRKNIITKNQKPLKEKNKPRQQALFLCLDRAALQTVLISQGLEVTLRSTSGIRAHVLVVTVRPEA